MKFNGFEHLTANYIYCPNQFFDVCLPHYSRGTVRLVSYMLRKTLGWLDEEGNPIEQNIQVSYRDLIDEAGISRGAIRKTIEEAVAGKFIHCVRPGKSSGKNQAAEAARYALRWAVENRYEKDFKKFSGFYAGEGYRTPIPNSFFDLVVRQETLAVVKVVGTVLRHTVGYQNQFGGRRQVAPLSYGYIQRYAHLSDRSTLSAAIQHAISSGYIRCVQKGSVHPSRNKRRPSTYAIRWHEQVPFDERPISALETDASIRTCWPKLAHFEESSSKTRPAAPWRFKKQTSSRSETRPAKRSKNQTEERRPTKDTYKQQSAVAVEDRGSYELLRTEFDERTATELASTVSAEQVRQQIEWLPYRNPGKNPQGLLRRALEGDWPKPDAVCLEEKKKQRLHEDRQETTEAELAEARAFQAKQAKRRRRKELLPTWHGLSAEQQSAIEQETFEQLNSDFFRDRFRHNEAFRLNQCLDYLAQQEELG